jgi:gliding motility-associated-like protein
VAFRQLKYIFLLLGSLSCALAYGQYLIENKGQWTDQTLLKLPMHYGGIHFEKDGLRIHLMDPDGPAFAYQRHQHEKEDETHLATANTTIQKAHTYRMHWLGSNANVEVEKGEKLTTYHNYLLGNEPTKWQSEVPLYMTARYKQVYPGIDVRFYFNNKAHLKYDLEVAPGADYSLFQTHYEGADSLWLEEGVLHISTSVGEVQELKPYAYQEIRGARTAVRCSYVLEGKTVGFKLGTYNRQEKLVIDPELVFSSFLTSSKEVYGFTATYASDGSMYAGGIAFQGNSGTSYPTLGAVIDTFSGGTMDIVISKLNSDGSQLVYSTYMGGNLAEMPYSMIEGTDGSLFVLGNTGSPNFPITSNATQDTFSGGTSFQYIGTSYPQGSDIFVLRLDSTGGNLLGSTFFGGTGNDGIGTALIQPLLFSNDQFRGEIIIDSLNNCYIATTTNSSDIDVSANAAQTAKSLNTDGLIASFNPTLSTRHWASYFGGTADDGCTSLRKHGQEIVVGGSTRSSGLQTSPSAVHPALIGGMDGFLLKLSISDGSFLGSTYTGSSQDDVNFFVDTDNEGNIYTLGASYATLPPSESTFFHQAGSHLYLQQYGNDLLSEQRTTSIGDSSTQPLLSPSAFEVDGCGNLLLSAWGRPNTLYTTPNALKRNKPSDVDNDFYFFILDASWKKVNYATYFGANKPPGSTSYGEHIDGGTSRFSPDGTIYQGICAACDESSNFPTTPGVFGPSRGTGRCNLAVVKFSTDAQEVKARVSPQRDTVCQFTSVNLLDSSYNADTYLLTQPDGTTISIDSLGDVLITNLGLNRFYIKAIDTTCGGIDSVALDIYGIDFSNEAAFEVDYDSCVVSDTSLHVHFTSFYGGSYQGIWDFGDGDSSNSPSPVHTYSAPGTYTVTLYVTTNACPGSLSQSKTFTLHPIQPLGIGFTADQCARTTANLRGGGRGYHQYIWLYADGGRDTGNSVSKDFIGQDGTQLIRCVAIDTICNRRDTLEKSVTLNFIDRPVAFPNVFTPNGDGINDYFGLLGDQDPNDFKNYNIQIFNRWGALVYSSNEVSNQWDGTEDKGVLPEGVYFYVANYLSSCNISERKQGFVHLKK